MTMGPVTSFNKVMLTSMLMFKLSNVNELYEFIRHLTIFVFFFRFMATGKFRKQRPLESSEPPEVTWLANPKGSDPPKITTLRK